jgi:hypothetical protein
VTSFGTEMLGLMAEAELAEGPVEPALAWLSEIAALSMSRRFRQAVGGRVAEFTYDNGAVAVRWLTDAEADTTLAGAIQGDALRDWPGALDYALHMPNCTAGDVSTIEAGDHWLDGDDFVPIERTIDDLTRRLRELRDPDTDSILDPWDVEFLETYVLPGLEFCKENHLPFLVW